VGIKGPERLVALGGRSVPFARIAAIRILSFGAYEQKRQHMPPRGNASKEERTSCSFPYRRKTPEQFLRLALNHSNYALFGRTR
jgi:hypothetical protein